MASFRHNQQSNKWATLTPLESKYPRWSPIYIGESIWISTECDGDGHCNEMVQIDCESNAVKQTVPYPNGFKPKDHSVCGSNQNGIVIVDGLHGKLIEFNPKNNKYKAPVTIPKFGEFTSCIMVNDFVHIIHGQNNSTNRYLIHSMKTGKVMEFKENLKTPTLGYVSIIKTDDGQYMKFGGYDHDNCECLDILYVGTEARNKGNQPIQWTKAPDWTLKKGMHGNGVITKGHYIITFGGCSDGDDDLDEIYILDIRSKTGWIQSPIKCPMKDRYVAVLDHQQRVHLFTFANEDKQHYSIALKDIVPGPAVSPMARRVSLKGTKQNDDEKEGLEVDENAKLRETNATLKAVNEILQHEVDRLKKTNADLIQKQNRLETEVSSLRNEVVIHEDERKEFEMKVAVLEAKILLWMMSLEDGRFEKYKDILDAALTAAELEGVDLLSVNALTFKIWGITDRKEREALNEHIQKLVEMHGSDGADVVDVADAAAPKENEGDSTAFVE